MKKLKLSILIIFFFLSAAAYGETILSSFEDIASYAAEHNSDYKNSQVDVLKADDDRLGIFLLKNSALSVNTDISDNLQGTSTGSGWYTVQQ